MTSSDYLVFGGKTYDLVPRVTPPVVDPPVDPPTPIAGRRRVLWHHGWQGPSIDSWPADVLGSLTTVIVAMSQSAKAGTGKLTAPPGATQKQIAGLASRGIDVLLGIGGSKDGGIALTNASQIADMVASVKGFAASYGYRGAVLDLEGAPGAGWTPDAASAFGHEMVWAGLKIGLCSATWGGRIEGWGQVARSLGDGLYHWERMFYDFPEAGDSRLSGIVAGDLAAMDRFVAREDQLVCTFMGAPPEGNYPNASPAGVIGPAYMAGRAAYRQAGWSVWESRIEGGRGWVNVRALAAV